MQGIQLMIMDDIRHYKRVSCDFYDQLVLYAMQKKMVRLETNSPNLSVVKGIIRDIYTLDGSEYCSIEGHAIRLDLIVKITLEDALD